MSEKENIVERLSFSAALLAGGKSSRMGFDKSILTVENQPLWRRQICLLQTLNPDHLFISGSKTGPWQNEPFQVLEDPIPHLGPMAALAEILQNIPTDRVLILAVDMPEMMPQFLQQIILLGRPIVPVIDGFFEPLAAVYSQKSLTRLRKFLFAGERSLQPFLRESVRANEISVYPVPQEEVHFFENVNTPSQRFFGTPTV